MEKQRGLIDERKKTARPAFDAWLTGAKADELANLVPTGGLVLHPLMGGMPPALGWESLELFASKVLPNLG